MTLGEGEEVKEIRAGRLVLATHTPMGRHLIHASLPPYRSYMAAVTLRDPVPEGLFWDTQDPYHYTRDYTTPQGQRLLLVGGADHKTGDATESENAQKLLKYIHEHYDVDQVVHQWSAQWYQPTDFLPMVGPSPGMPEQLVITGLSGNGLTGGTWGGMQMAKVCGQGAAFEETFTPARGSLVTNKEFLKANMDVALNLIKDRLKPKESLDDIAPGSGGIIFAKGQNVAVWKSPEGKVCAYSATCPHMKGVVMYNDQEKSFDCPCHGQRFHHDGTPIDGPSPHAMDKVDLG